MSEESHDASPQAAHKADEIIGNDPAIVPPRAGLRSSWMRRLVKWTLLAAVLVFVVRRASQMWDPESFANVRIRWSILIPAGLTYGAGWLPAVWFWRRLLRSMGFPLPLLPVARAYYCGHPAKYIPGKASSLVIRSALLVPYRVPIRVSGVTSTLETLACMGSGILAGFVLLPLDSIGGLRARLPASLQTLVDSHVAVPVILLTLTLAAMPIVSRLLTHLARRLTPSTPAVVESDIAASDTSRIDASLIDNDINEPSPRVGSGLLIAGVVAFLTGWCLHGLSLSLTIESVVGDGRWLERLPACTSAVSLGTSLGFLALFAPGGIGVREAVIVEILRVLPGIGSESALVATLLLRVVWLTTELAIAGLLYYYRRD